MIMAGSGSDPPGFRLDIKQILSEAQHRWLRPAEICEILQNYRNFHITPEAPYRPVSGSVFLFDRKVLRYFRKDGHNWRKKKDGKTVKEAHEKLKVGSIDVLHCYYAHGEEDDNFQRRSYWMLEQDLMHIVFVHYLEVKGNKANVSSNRSIESAHSNYVKEYSLSDTFHGSHKKLVSLKADSASLASTVTSAYEEAESEDSHQVCSRFHSYPELVSGMDSHLVENRDTISKSYGSPLSSVEYPSLPGIDGGGKCDLGNSASGPQRTNDLGSRAPVFEHCSNGEVVSTHDFKNNMPVHGNWQYSLEGSPLQFLGQTVNQDLIADSCYDLLNGFHSENLSSNQYTVRGQSYMYPDEQDEQQTELNFQNLNSPMEVQADIIQENFMDMLGLGDYSTIKQPRLGSVKLEEGLNKSDSFSRWVAKELEDVEELHMQSTDRLSWNVIDIEDDCSCLPSQLHVDSDSLVPSLSQEQLFSIIDFSPNWAYSSLETKVLITGRFLKSDCKVVECKWSCMFGEVEVPAEVLADGVLRCHAPPHKPGVLPFYVTCSNRLACSEVREFEYRLGPSREFGASNVSAIEMHLLERFESVMSLEPVSSCYSSDSPEAAPEKQSTVNKIICMMEEDMADRPSDFDTSQSKVKEDLFLERKLRQNFYVWLVHQVTADGKGRTVLDDEGQGVLHLAAALGYDWALRPILASGVSVDFRDLNGWTALHWAAFYGREKTVVGLVSLGASPGALTDPSAEFPLGRTPADLASANRHKGISGFLAESSLTSHLSKLTVTDAKEELASEVLGAKVGETVTERVAVTSTGDDVPDVLSLKDSLAAIRNATQAAARIHQIFRVQSFQRKQIIENNDNELSSDEHALSVVASRTCKLAQNNGIAHAAAIQIQKKFRGWNKRKEFLFIRQRIVKIQAHVRGHQVRKKYKPIIWSVGILEKVILRWRRKGSGLRGFRSDAVMNKPSTEDDSLPEDDYDFLKEGRKQTEVRMQKALARVKSMTQYPEARAQYRRLLTAAEGLRETKEDGPTQVLENQKDASYAEEDLFDVDNLLDEDTFMSIAFD